MESLGIKCDNNAAENLDGETADEANNLLGNGILVETNKG